MKHLLKNWVTILFTISLVAIIAALVAEFFFNLSPCNMCLKQRHPYYAIMITTILFITLQKQKSIWLFIINEFAIVYGLFYAVWHVGIEKKILPGPASCSGSLSKTSSIQNLKEQISNQAVVNCTDIIWTILGFSAATVNSILLLLILIYNSIYIFNFYGPKKK
mgnify:CR=1 FL=1